MKNSGFKYRAIISSYFVVLFIYFTFFLATGGIEYSVPFLFDGEIGSQKEYGYFLSLLNIAEIVFPIIVVFLSQKYSSIKVNAVYMMLSITCAFMISYIDTFPYAFGALFLLCCTRLVFNFSIGNDISFMIPAEMRSKYFAIRDMFIYGGIGISSYLCSKIIYLFEIKRIFFLLSLILIITLLATYSIKGKFVNINQKDETLGIKEYIACIKKICRSRIFIVLIIIQTASVIYSVILKFIPLRALEVGVQINSFLKYASVFSIINGLLSIILSSIIKTSDRKIVFIIDILLDVLSVVFFIISKNGMFLLIGYGIALLKDMLAPISFSYVYDCLEKDDNRKIAPVKIGLLNAISNCLAIACPSIIGVAWKNYFNIILFLSGIILIIAVLSCYFVLPRDEK